MAARAGTAAGAAATRRPRGAAFRRYWTWYLFIAPNLIVFLVFTLFSWGFMLFLSLHDWNLVGRRTFVGWGNYA